MIDDARLVFGILEKMVLR